LPVKPGIASATPSPPNQPQQLQQRQQQQREEQQQQLQQQQQELKQQQEAKLHRQRDAPTQKQASPLFTAVPAHMRVAGNGFAAVSHAAPSPAEQQRQARPIPHLAQPAKQGRLAPVHGS